MAVKSLWGAEFDIPDEKEKVKKISKKIKETKPLTPEEAEALVKKQAKSKSIPFEERLKIIEKEVYRVLGKQANNVITIRTREELHSYIDKCIANGHISVDTETNNSTNSCNCEIAGLCLYTDSEKQAYVPIGHRDYYTHELLPNQVTAQDVREELQRAVDAKIEFDYHNAPFDYQVMSTTCGIDLPITWDTMIAARVLNENELAGLKFQYSDKIDNEQEKYSIDDLFEGIEYVYLPPELFALYAATDSMDTRKLKNHQEDALKLPENLGLNPLLREIELPVVAVCAKMEQRGVRVDMSQVERLSKKYHAQLDKCDAEIAAELERMAPEINAWKLTPAANAKPIKKKKKVSDVVIGGLTYTYIEGGEAYGASSWQEKATGKGLTAEEIKNYGLDAHVLSVGKSKAEQLTDPINLGSPTQLAIIFYDVLGCESVSKKSPRGTGEDELKALDKNYNIPLCKLMLKRRTIVKLLSTYIDNIPELVSCWNDGKIRTHFKQYGADTGRFASGGSIKFMRDGKNVEISGVNLQNIPAYEKSLRMIFQADNFEERVPDIDDHYVVNKFYEVETQQGWCIAEKLQVGDVLISDEGSCTLQRIVSQGDDLLLYCMSK